MRRLTTVAAVAVWLMLPSVARAADRSIRPLMACPTDLPTLTALLLRDLPSYANRVTQRSFPSLETRSENRPGYILLAGRPEFEPLSLGPGEYSPTTEAVPQQIFFTTLERQYVDNRSIAIQHYHWVFLARSADWWLVTMRSQVGNLPANQPPTPPQDTSQGAIAQAIRLWLRDCRYGAVTPDG